MIIATPLYLLNAFGVFWIYLQFSNEPPNIAWLENMTVKTNFSARYSCSSGTVFFLWYNKLFKAISHYSKAEYKYKSHLCFYSKTMYYKELSCLEIPERLFGAAVSTLQRIPIACSVFLSILLWRYGWSSYVTYPQLSLPQWFLSARHAHSAGWLKPLCLTGSS